MRDNAPKPCTTHAEAIGRFSAMAARDSERVNPVCTSKLLEHGDCADEAVVLLHGYTNCPAQWTPIAARLFARGSNVLVPRYPHHGYSDRLNRDLSRLKSSELIELTRESIDIAVGLGRTVTVVGFSAGGAMGALAAATRDEVGRVMLVAPIFSPWGLPHWASDGLTRLLRTWPDRYTWWDPRVKEGHRPEYGYPRMSLHGLAALLEIGADALSEKEARSTRIERAVLVLNRSDMAVNADAARRAAHAVLAPISDVYVEYEFPLSEKLSHDIITPEGSNEGRTETVADRLMELLYE